jgi:glycosyltransferase involved in cell wall biosynthesis
MTRGPLFSVIIPSYGRPEFLRAAVDSVLTQTVEDFECIVVDDATPQPLEVPTEPRIRLIRRASNGGGAAAMNTGLEHARGRYVTFLDDDDLFTTDRLALALEGLRRAPIAICWGRWIDQRSEAGRILDGDVLGEVHEGMTPHTGTTTVVREVTPRFDESFRTVYDVEWWVRAAGAGHVSTIPQTGYLNRRHPGHRHLSGKAERVRDSIRLLHLHADYFQHYPQAQAFRWRRIGVMSRQLGDYKLARAALQRAIRLDPGLRTLWHFVRSAQRSTAVLREARQVFEQEEGQRVPRKTVSKAGHKNPGGE